MLKESDFGKAMFSIENYLKEISSFLSYVLYKLWYPRFYAFIIPHYYPLSFEKPNLKLEMINLDDKSLYSGGIVSFIATLVCDFNS